MRILIAAPLLLLLVLFALSNPQHINLGIWPTDLTLEAPLSLVVLVGMGIGFFLGSLMLWFSAVAARRRARRADNQARRLQARVTTLEAQLAVRMPDTTPSRGLVSATALPPPG